MATKTQTLDVELPDICVLLVGQYGRNRRLKSAGAVVATFANVAWDLWLKQQARQTLVINGQPYHVPFRFARVVGDDLNLPLRVTRETRELLDWLSDIIGSADDDGTLMWLTYRIGLLLCSTAEPRHVQFYNPDRTVSQFWLP